MTDDSVIEEAAKAGREAYLTSLSAETVWVRVARAAFAVFEKAHAPTDDEREALAWAITVHRFHERGLRGRPMEPDIAIARPLADTILAAGFRRSEVPEPSDENMGPAAGCAYCVGAGGYEDHDGEWARCSCQLPEPQGEPSDAQVKAAQQSLLSDVGWVRDSYVYAALRAAGGVRYSPPLFTENECPNLDHPFSEACKLCGREAQSEPSDAAAADPQPLELDPTPWVFISDQVFGVPRSAVDKGFHSVSGAYWAFSPGSQYEQDRARYGAAGEAKR